VIRGLTDRMSCATERTQALEPLLVRAEHQDALNRSDADSRATRTSDGVVRKVMEILATELRKKKFRTAALFEEFDEEGDGHISARDFQYAMGRLGVSAWASRTGALLTLLSQVRLTDSQLADVVRVFDTDGSGAIDYDEFAHSVEDSVRVEASPRESSTDGASLTIDQVGEMGIEGEFEAELMERIRTRVWNKYGSAQQAWKVYHVAHGRKPYVRCSTLLRRLRAEGFPSLTSSLLTKLLENHGIEGSTMDYPQFRRFLTSPLPSAEATSRAMGNTETVDSTPTPLPAQARSIDEDDSIRPKAVTVELLKELGDRFARTSKSVRDIHTAMKRHGSLGCSADDMVWEFHKLGKDVTPAEAVGLIDHYDDDRDGLLSFPEFLELVRDAAMAAGTM
jgi:Ca2+-binding EF-hand superfamily protein